MIKEELLKKKKLKEKQNTIINIILLGFLFLLPTNIYALSKAPIDITNQTIESLNDYLNSNIITSEELVNIYLDRIKTYSEYNAIITINDKAIEEARRLDDERSKGKIRSQLHGIPIIVKDNIDVKNMPTTAGARALSNNYPKEDAEVIKKLKKAGAIILAKSNMSEFAFQASSSRSSYGTVKNAYNKEYSSYGSSGGSAVSVALSFAPAALGTDTDSSIRIPASAANIIGYRPTTNLISNNGVLPYDPERDTVGILAKTVNDTIIINNIISSKRINLNTKEAITIGVPKDFIKGDNSNILPENKEIYVEIEGLINSVISKLEKNNINIVYLDSYYTTNQNYYVEGSYSGFLFCDSFNDYLAGTTGTIRSFYELSESNNKITDLKLYGKHCNTTRTLDEKNKLKSEYRNYLTKIYREKELDVIMYPTTKNKLLKSGQTGLVNLSAHASSTVNYPAISMPLGFDKDNLPYGIEFMSLNNDDNNLLNIAKIYESINYNNNLPQNAPNLYAIDKEVNILIDNYKNKKNKILLKSDWSKKVKKFFKNYNENKNVSNDAKMLNKQFKKLVLFSYLIRIIPIILLYLINKFFFKRKKSKKQILRRKIFNDRIYTNRKRKRMPR